jgi:NADH:ubiquinone oxidoreductase subunit 6 (subunit J)
MRTLRPRQAWGIGVLVAAGGLLALVAVAADGSPLRAPPDSGSSDLAERLLAVVEVILVVAVALFAVLVVMAFTSDRRKRPQFSRKRSLLQTIVGIALLVLIPFAVGALRRGHAKHQPDDTGPTPPTTVATADDGGGRPTWPIVTLGAVVVVALAGAAWMAGRRRPIVLDDDEDVGERRIRTARSAFDASLADLEAEPDPRAAIIAAYGRLLDGFDECGLGRRASEAPMEHMGRALRSLALTEQPVRDLVTLYAEARFSEHTLDAGHKARAIAAFRAARDELAATARPAAPAVTA